MSGFIPRHIEHPDSRHSKPASRKILCRPSCSAACLTACDHGTTMARTLELTLYPLTTRAAARKSSRSELVQEPMNKRYTEILRQQIHGNSAMTSNIRTPTCES